MAFIDNLKDAAQKAKTSVKNTAAVASEKTKNFVEVQKLTSSIHDEEKLIVSWKTEIGEIYWSRYLSEEALPEDVADLCKKIGEALERISCLESEIQSYKEKKEEEKEEESGIFCPSCGVKSPQGTAFCSNCGKDLRGI